MRRSRVLVVTAALSLTAAMSVLPAQVASAESPSTAVLVPSNNATVSGARVILDAGASAGVTQVQFEVSGGPANLNDLVVATAVPTYYGWIAEWNSTTVANGSYSLQSVASLSGGRSVSSSRVTITVNNPPPSTTVIIPSSGATLDTSKGYVIDALASPGVTQVSLEETANGITETFPNTPTIYGWINVEPGGQPCSGCIGFSFPISIQSVSSYSDGVTGTSPAVNATIVIYLPSSVV